MSLSLNSLANVAAVESSSSTKKRNHKETSNEDRELIVKLFVDEGMTAPKIGLMLNNRVNVKTIYSIIRCYKQELRTEKKPKKGSPKKFNEEERKLLCELQEKDTEATYKDLKRKWEETLSKNEEENKYNSDNEEKENKRKRTISIQSIHRILTKENDFTTKNLYVEPAIRNTPELIEERKSYSAAMFGIEWDDLIFLDETGFNLQSVPTLWCWTMFHSTKPMK